MVLTPQPRGMELLSNPAVGLYLGSGKPTAAVLGILL